MTSNFIHTIAFLFMAVVLQAQSIRFLNDNLDSALKIAEREGKDIFVDTYAPWCIPCKKMEKVFMDPEVGRYFNDHFVSIRINMDNPIGDEIRRKYDVIFLPTIMILDKNGGVKYQVDRVLSKTELLDIGKMVYETNAYFVSEATAINSNPMSQKKVEKKTVSKPPPPPVETVKKVETKPAEVIVESPPVKEEVVEEPEEKILYVLGQDAPPEIMRQEAYFRMQLMDGSHRSSAKKYLSTQKDWSTPENMRFIHDFLHSTSSDEFRYYIINRHKFEPLVGKLSVQETIEILVDKTLNQGFPRPTRKEAQALLSYVNPRNSRTQSYRYMLDRHYFDQNHGAYLDLLTEYCEDINTTDVDVFYTACNVCIESEADEMDKCVKLMDRAIELRSIEPRFYETLAYVYFQKFEKKKALKVAEKGLEVTSTSDPYRPSLMKMLEKIKSL